MIKKQTRRELEQRVKQLEKSVLNSRRLKEELLAARQQLEDIIQSLPDPTFVIGRKKKIVTWNRAIEKLTGLSKEEMVGRGDNAYAIPFWGEARQVLVDLIMDRYQDDVLPYDTIERCGDSLVGEAFLPNFRGGQGIHVWLKASPLYDKHGNITGAIETIRDITRLKETEKALQENIEQRQAILDGMPDRIRQVDTSMTVLWANNTVLEIHPDSLGLPCYQSAVNRQKPCQGCPALKCLNTGRTEREIIHHPQLAGMEGESYWENIGVPLKNKSGKILGAIEIARNITDRVLAKKKLREAQELLEAAVAQSPSGILIADAPDVRIRLANQAAFGIRGGDLKVLKGIDLAEYSKNWQTFRPDGTLCPKDSLPLSRAVLRGEVTQNEELILRDQEGNDHWVSSNAAPVKNEMGQTIAGIVVSHDITEQKRVECELRVSQRRLQAIFNTSPDPIVVYNNNGHPEYMNAAFTRIFGWCLDELKNSCVPFVPGSQKEITRLKIEEIYQSGNPVRFETKRLTKDERTLDVLLSAAMLKDFQEQNQGLVVNLKDITANKKLEAQIRQTQKMESIGTLAGGIAHDFNNILFPVLGYTEMLLQDIPKDNPAHSSLEKIYKGAIRARDLVKQILTFSRQESSELKPMKLQPLIKEALKLIRSTIPTSIEIRQDIDPKCGVVNADPTQIHQIIMNLTTNSYHAMEETGGTISVSLKEIKIGEFGKRMPDVNPGLYACLMVTDTGKGMEKALAGKIFDPFFTTKAVGKGTGMGLSVVHGIVTGMAGVIKVYSEPLKGTQFTVYLPVENSWHQLPDARTKEPVKGGTERILLVDDEETILSMEKELLERLGYRVTPCAGSIEALQVFRRTPDAFDLIITDMAMPEMSGDKLSVELMQIRSDISILISTGFSEILSGKEADSLGIKGFVMKPIVLRDFALKIRDLLDKTMVERVGDFD